jgi:hypothetical protein
MGGSLPALAPLFVGLPAFGGCPWPRPSFFSNLRVLPAKIRFFA